MSNSLNEKMLHFILENIDTIEFKKSISKENIKLDFVDYEKEKKVKLYYETFHNKNKNTGDD